MSNSLFGNHSSNIGRLGQLWYWWTGELKNMLPSSVRRSIFTGQTMILTAEKRVLILCKETTSGLEEVEQAPLTEIPGAQINPKIAASTCDVVLCLSAEYVFSRTLALPLVAEENLREVLSFEMDRHTPFNVDQVYYDYLVRERDREKGKLSVTVYVVLRDKLDRLLDEIEQRGLHVTQVTSYQETPEDRPPVNLLPEREALQGRSGISVLNAVLLVTALVLMGAATGLPIWYKQQTVELLKPRLAEAQQEAKSAVTLKQSLDRKIAESRFLFEKKQASVFLLEIINELTVLLPDDTWLSHLELDGDEVRIRGESPAAASLIPLVESSSLFHNTRFRSPVTQNRRTNAERFHLSAQVKREGGKP
jgi:general secretion pathway protein L